MSVDVKTNCVTLMLNICPNCDRHRILRNLHLFLGQLRDQKGPPSTLLQRSTIRRKNKLSSFLRQILRFLPLGNIRRFIRLGAKGVPKPFPHLRGDIEPHQISRDRKWGAPEFSFSTNNYWGRGARGGGVITRWIKPQLE